MLLLQRTTIAVLEITGRSRIVKQLFQPVDYVSVTIASLAFQSWTRRDLLAIFGLVWLVPRAMSRTFDRYKELKIITRADGRFAVNVPAHLNNGKRTNRAFPQKLEAEKFVNEMMRKQLAMSSPAVFDEEEALWVRLAKDRLARHNKSLRDAIDHYLSYLETGTSCITITEATRRHAMELQSLTDRNQRSQSHLNCMNRCGQILAQEFGAERLTDQVTVSEMQELLMKLSTGAGSFNAWRRKMKTWFGWLQRRELIQRNPVEGTIPLREDMNQEGIITVDNLHRLLRGYLTMNRSEHEESDMRQLLLGCFAGLRQSECRGLKFGSIDLVENLILVVAGSAKTRRSGFARIHPVLKEWMRPWFLQWNGDRETLVCPSWPYKRTARFYEQMDVDVPENAFRRSFASHHYAHWNDPLELQRDMRHAENETSLRHYRRLVKPEEGRRWFESTPDAIKKSNA
jgi:integrase